jgi:hypothetical protein
MRSPLTLLVSLVALAGSAFAQPEAAPPTVAPVPSNPGAADAPAEIARTPTGAVAEPAAEVASPASDAGTVVLSAPAAEAVAGAPKAEPQGDELEGKISAALRIAGQRTSAFPVDQAKNQVESNPLETRLRIEPEVRYGPFGLVADLETTTGALAGLPPAELVGDRTAHPALSALELRELYLEVKGKTWLLRAGQQAANWGLGIVANPGTRDPAPGEGFGDARFGDSSYRVMAAGRPFFSQGGGWRGLELVAAADMVVKDDTADYWAQDRALQGVLAVSYKEDDARSIGVYAVLRRQRSALAEDTRGTDAFVVDFAGKWRWSKHEGRAFMAGFEVVSISGSTTMARSVTAPVQQLRQFGAALKASWQTCSWQVYLDAGYASGDHNPYDDRAEAFRFDPDYHVGLVLFDEVMGYQSARAGVLASDPSVVGVAPDGVNLVPSRGAVTGAAYLFPRVRHAFAEWFDVYGGPLFAFSTAKLTDVYATRIAGGVPTNALGGAPGNYLGTELDIGAQARFHPHPAVLITATAEAGLLVPGDAFNTPSGGVLGPVGLGRLRLGVSL